MQRAIEHKTAGHWPAAQAIDSVTLDFDARHRRRIVLQTDSGAQVLMDLERAVAMADSDGLRLEEGGYLTIRAAAEPLLAIQASDPEHMLRLAWHVGNRHLPVEVTLNTLYIRPDPVIEKMLVDLGARVRTIRRAFQPEGGAYGGHGSHSDGHSHDH